MLLDKKPDAVKSSVIRLNLGCGRVRSNGWINIDRVANFDVVAHDITKPLPYGDATVDFVYASHVLEHLDLQEANALLLEIHRVLKSSGIVRLVVPDLEEVARSYLEALRSVRLHPTEVNQQRYDWLLLELLDQLVRYNSGGLMLQAVFSNQVDREFVKYRSGDEFDEVFKYVDQVEAQRAVSPATNPPDLTMTRRLARTRFLKPLKNAIAYLKMQPSAIIRRVFSTKSVIRPVLARDTGELHRWMYDSFSLERSLRRANFKHIEYKSFNESSIPEWQVFGLDVSSNDRARPRKPHSLYVEAKKVSHSTPQS